MILQRLCNYFARCVQLDEFIRREQVGMSFVLHRHGPVECPSFPNPGLPHAANASASEPPPGAGTPPFRSLPPFGIFWSGGDAHPDFAAATVMVGASVHVFMKVFHAVEPLLLRPRAGRRPAS